MFFPIFAINDQTFCNDIQCITNNSRAETLKQHNFVVQAADEDTDELLALTDQQLGRLVRDTWISGQYIKFKRMLLRTYNESRNVDWRVWTVQDRMSFLQELEAGLPPTARPRANVQTPAQAPQHIPDDNGDEPLGEFRAQSMDNFIVQSKDEVEMPSTSTSAPNSEENVVFMDESGGESCTFNKVNDSATFIDSTPTVGLENFLSRPVLIKTRTWLESDVAGVIDSFNPWYLYFSKAAISRKLDNYAFLSCNLHIKVIINASPFYYGSMIMNYQPLAGVINGNIRSDASLHHLIPHSQRPHIWLYPQLNQGGDMVLPFFYHKNWLHATSAADLQNMGSLALIPYTTLQSANGAVGTGVTVQVYAWAENVKVMGPTIDLSVQSADEYGDGVVSKSASAIANAAGMLSSVPIIGRYATATSFAANAIGRIAHLFGFTNVPNVNNVEPYKNMPFAALSSTQISTPVDKMTIDPKNELTIDPRIVGLAGEDELMIKNMIKKESYLCYFNLSTSDSVDGHAFNALATPLLHGIGSGSYPLYQFTPLSYAQFLFKYWRGDIVFRFKFICTKFHKGRVRITFDPSGDIANTADSTTTAFNEIVDIGDSTDVEIVVPYMQATAFLNTRLEPTAGPYWSSDVGGIVPVSHDGNFDNGIISVRVLTVLSAPTATSTIPVQVFVRAGDNFEYGLPRDPPQGYSAYEVQSQDEVSFGQPVSISAGDHVGAESPDQFLVNFGERIVSFRQLLRRSTFTQAVPLPIIANTNTYSVFRHVMTPNPLYYGYDTSGVNSAKGLVTPATDYPFNFVKNTPYNWLSRMFLGQRGAMIYNYNLDTSGYTNPISSFKVTRNLTAKISSDWSAPISVGSSSADTYVKFLLENNIGGVSGISLTNQLTQTGLAVSLPDYNRYKFRFVDPTITTNGGIYDDSDVNNYFVTAALKPSATNSTANLILDKYVSIGTDFTFLFWICCPTWQYCPLPTPT